MYGIFTYIWLIFMVNVGEYIPYMDGMGIEPHPPKKLTLKNMYWEILGKLL